VRRRVCLVFAALLAGSALFLWRGDGWLAAAAEPGGTKTLWDVWVGFPPGLAHGMALFFAVLVVWNLWTAARGARR
jgi:hypothetical protein